MLERAAGLSRHDLAAVGSLQRMLTLCSLGVAVTGTSHHGSMGEHQISHWIDMFATGRSAKSKHGHQVGVASLTMARIQHALLSRDSAPEVAPTVVDEAGMLNRYGPVLGPLCIAECRKTALDVAGAAAFNQRLADLWPTLKDELAPMALPVATMKTALVAAGGPTTPAELGLSRETWRDAVRYSREIRGRWSFVNLAADAGLLDAVLDAEP
jgi:glycerol-1-phosphate dehydrogenase [NAD(P)+]